VLDPDKLAISFTALIHIICCLKIYLHQTMEDVQDKCNRDCNCDYFQCNRLHCDFVYL